MSSNLCSEKLEQYNYHRQKLIDLCVKAEKLLSNAQHAQNRHHAYEIPAEKLKADTYTLVLIGAFQSGKSTLFNYLCDGRELSPIGPGGGGIRTSGCQVTAHSVPEGAEERAEIIWRKPSEILSALGGRLIKYYEKPSTPDALTEKEVNLSSAKDRRQLAGFAVQELTNPSETLNDNDRELLRFTLIICKFYDQFAARCAEGKSACTLAESVKLSSYPQDWSSKWQKIEETEDWSLADISADEVNFAFCGGVELFLDSAVLRGLGCSIIDCPGLFISKWDTDIATRCIKSANAILYMFGGDKELTQEDLKALQTAVQLGGRHKIVFGANLHVSQNQWKNILQKSIIPTLKTNGFENPVVHNFHSAIALRSRELMLAEYDMLSEMSENAIKLDIALGQKEMTVEAFLRRMLNKHISTLTDWDKNLSHYEGDYPALETLSGVPGFVSSSNEFVVSNRAVSILVHEGTQQVNDTMRLAVSELQQKVQLLESDVSAAQDILNEETGKLESFKESRDLHVGWIKSAVATAETAILNHYKALIDAKIKDRKDDLIRITQDKMPSTFVLPFVDKNKRIQEYSTEVGEVLGKVLQDVRKEILTGFTALPAFVTLKAAFEGHRNELMKKAEAFKEIKGMVGISPQFPSNFAATINGMTLPRAEELMSVVFDENGNFWNWIWTILTFGIKDFFINSWDRAAAIVNEFLESFQNTAYDNLKACMNQEQPSGPLTELKDCYNNFRYCFENVEKVVQDNLDGAKTLLNDVKNKASIVPEFKRLQEELKSMEAESQRLEARIREDFPA